MTAAEDGKASGEREVNQWTAGGNRQTDTIAECVLKLRAQFQVALCPIIQRARLTTSHHHHGVRPRAPSSLLPTSPEKQTLVPGTPHLSRKLSPPHLLPPGAYGQCECFRNVPQLSAPTVHVDAPVSSSAVACLSPLALLLAVWTGAQALVPFLANVCSTNRLF